ncbi:putative GDSL lipase/esterase, SGNH hydrolase superfamily [Dioscorea sansibarensis]
MHTLFLLLISLPRRQMIVRFENSWRGCCATGLFEMSYLCNQWSHVTCPDADKYVFWDSFHPTQKMNRILARHAVDTYMRSFM